MYERDLPLLACPLDRSPLALKGEPKRAADGEILEAELVSKAGKVYPVTNGIPRFTENTGYNATWDFKWTEIDRGRGINYHQIGADCRPLYEFDPYGEDGWRHLRGRHGLEIGCGVGQWSVTALRDHGADRMVSVDLTRGVDVFRKIVEERFPDLKPRLLMVQASVFAMPFAPETFDYMFSFGVLHHTGSTLEAIRKACAVVKHGGEANIWVYCPRLIYLEDREPGHIYQVRRLSYPRRIVKVPQQLFVKFWMTVCRHLPVEKAYRLARFFSADWWWRFGNLPVVGFIPRMIFSAVDDPDRDFRLINIFDAYVNTYAEEWNEHEIFPVLKECGIVVKGISPWRTGMWGVKWPEFYRAEAVPLPPRGEAAD
jgi:SAM-dependent methyltransferase